MMEGDSFSCTCVNKNSKVLLAFSTFDTSNNLMFSNTGFICLVHYVGVYFKRILDSVC